MKNVSSDNLIRGWDRNIMASKIANDLPHSSYVNLGNDTEFNLKKEQLHYQGIKINLSSNEIKILKLLIHNSHQYLTRDLLNTELGLDFLSRSGDMQISRLRLKIKKECHINDLIRSVHGKGYKIFL